MTSKADQIGVPALSSPMDGVCILDSSVQFCWGSTEDGFGYELQYARCQDFSDARSFVVQNLLTSTRHSHLPEDRLSSGRWFWRVRTMTVEGIFGRWSPVRTLTSVSTLKKTDRELKISADHPLFIFHYCSNDDIVAYWTCLPEHLKPYVALRVERHNTEDMIELCEVAERHGIPILLQLAGPHDSYSGNYARIPLGDVEYMYQTYSVVKGTQIVEQSCQGGIPQPRVTGYLIGMMKLAAAYGKVAVWADATWHGNNIWIDTLLHEELFRTMQECGEWVVPMWKMNCGWMPYSVQGPLYGLLASGTVANWGIEPESWFWYEAGFHEMGVQAEFKEGDASLCPETFWGQMTQMGLSSGATVYCYEPQGGVWSGPGEIAESAKRVIFPLMTRIIDWGLVPTREELLARGGVAYIAGDGDTPWRQDGGALRTVYEGSYGLDHPYQVIPRTARFGWIPVMSPHVDPDVLSGYSSLLHAGSFRTAADVQAFFDSEYEARETGSAWSFKLDGLWLVTNHHENRDITERFVLPLEGPFVRIEGEVEVNGYLYVQQTAVGGEDGGAAALRVHLNGRPERVTSLRFFAAAGARIVLDAGGADGLVSQKSDPSTGVVECKVSFADGAVDLEVRISEVMPTRGSDDKA